MPFESINPLGGFTGIAEPQEPEKFTDVNPETRPFQPQQPGLWGAAFRTENTIGSSISSETVRTEREQRGVFGGPVKIDPDFDPWAEIAGTAYEPYYEQFATAGNKTHFESIRADIERENKDRDVISQSGIAGLGASMAAGVFDLPTLVPGGAILRSASGGVSILKTAATTAVAGATAASLSELTLQGTQQLRTAEESAFVIGGSVVLSGLLGAGFGKLFSRLEQGGLAARVEQDFLVPGLDRPDPYSPGSIKVDTASGALRAYHASPYDFDRFNMDKIGTGEGTAFEGHGIYLSDDIREGQNYRIQLGADQVRINGNPIGDDLELQQLTAAKINGEDSYGRTIDDIVAGAEESVRSIRAMPEPTKEDAAAVFVSLEKMKSRQAQNLAEAEALLSKAKQVRDGDVTPGGALYEVEIAAEKSDFLDLFARLEEQPAVLDKVRSAYREAGLDEAKLDGLKGTDAYNDLDEALGGQKQASEALAKSGIVGNRYASADDATNFVVFDASRLTITKKNGQPVTAAERKMIAAAAGGGKSVGAAARDSVDNTLKSAFGLEKAAAFMVPELRLFTSKSDVTKRYAQELYETALAFKKNAAGNETAPLGTELGAPGAVETRVKFWQAPLAEAASAVDDAFFKYRKGRQKRMVGELSAITLKDTVFGTEALTYRGFKEEISKAMRRLDTHEIPEVAQAAKTIRQKVLDPLKDEAIAAKLLPEDIDPETAPSYLNRIYNRERIIAERDQFKAVIRNWLEETETNNSAVRARVSTALGTLKSEQEAIKRIEAKIARRKASGKEADIEGLQIEIEEINLRVKDLTKQIEAEVVKYQGKSAKEAQRAVDTRTEAEGVRDADAPELRAADKPVLQAAKKIARQVDKEPAELDDLADQIIDRLIGTPEGRLPYDAHMDTVNKGDASQQVRGPLNARVFMIPDRLIEPWLENDAEALMRAYVRTMAPDVELTKRFGSADMTLQMKEIQEDYARRSAAATSPEQRKKINAQKNADIRDLAAVRDRLRGMYRLPSDPDAMMVRAGRVIGAWNFMRMLGGMTVSAVPDLARPIMVHGVMRTFGDGLFPLMTNWSNAKLAMKEVKLAGTALDMVLDSRAMRIADVVDEFGRGTKFERAVQSGARNFGIVSLMAPWNAAIKQFAGLITMSRILQTTDALAKGKIKPKDLEALAAGGISELNARKIAEQFKKYGVKQGTVWMPNTHRWDADARPAMEAFRAALVRDVDRIIVTPGIADRPLWMSYELGRLVGQFKSFAIASMQKTLISGLQQSDTSVLAGVALMTALGGLVHVVKARGGDHDPGVPKEWGMNKETSQFMVNAVDRAGLTGWLMEANNITEKVSRGTVGLSALTGKPVGRYASRNITASMLGPSVGTVEDFIRVTGAAVEGEWNATDSRTMKRLIPYNNLFYLRSAFDAAQTNIDSYFGVPDRAAKR